MPSKEVDALVEQSSRKLLQVSIPPVRYWLLTQVMERTGRDALLKQTVDQCATFPPKLKLLDKMSPDGTWPIPRHKKLAEEAGPGPPLGWTYRSMLWNFFTLAEYRADRSEGFVDRGLHRFFEWQNDEGYIAGPWTNAIPLPYYNGYALHVLLRFGLDKEKGTRRMIDWLLSMQRADGGWNIPYMMDIHYLPEYKGMRMRDFIEYVRHADKARWDLKKYSQFPSCPYSTLLATWGLMKDPVRARSDEVMRGADFVLDNFFKKTAHPSFYMTADHWTRLRYPYKFGSGLHALDMLTEIGYGADDVRMHKPIEWLRDSRGPDGLWAQANRPHPERDQWISLIALRTLKRYAKSL